MATARATVKEKKAALAGVRQVKRGARAAKPEVAQAAYRQALEHQAATAEILRVIAAAPHDSDAIFKAITQAGRRLMPDVRVSLFIVRDAMIHYVSHSGVSSERRRRLATLFPIPLDRKSISGSAILDKRVHTVSDTQAPQARRRYERTARTSRVTGSRASIALPLLTKGSAVGALNLTRSDPVAFADHEVTTARIFADQAVIAIENARLFNETRGALEQQTATSEVLKSISRSTFDLQAVLQVLIENATRLAGANQGFIFRFDGQVARLAFSHNAAPAYKALMEANPIPPGRGTLVARTLLEKRPVHIPDALADEEYTWREAQRLGGFRSMLGVPMMREGTLIGVIAMWSDQVKPFTDRQISLVSTFADQAVIAIENVRLFNETKESLEQQTAISDVLRVISGSPTDVMPVLEAVAARAAKICEASDARIFVVEGQTLRHVAGAGDVPLTTEVLPLDRGSPSARAVIDRAPQHIEDINAESADEWPVAKRVSARSGWRTILTVPLLREGDPLGVIVLRRVNVRPFTGKQIALLQTFADQAAIAIENVRLFNETKEALERQTATAEILNVISRSPTDVGPVFETIVRAAIRLMAGRSAGVFISDGTHVDVGAAFLGDENRTDRFRQDYPASIDYRAPAVIAIKECRILNVPDLLEGDYAESVKQRARGTSYRSVLSAPMLRAGKAVGSIAVTRAAPGLFSDNHVALLKTFADQAVIAIENVRLFKELQSRTEALTKSVGQLTALGEVGRAIGSTLDLETVLKTIVSRAVQLSGLSSGSIYEYDEQAEEFRLRAGEGMTEETVAILRNQPIRKGEGTVGATAVRREPVQVADIHSERYDTRLRDILVRAGRRAVLAVPLMHEERIIGALAVQKDAAGPFAPEVVELLRTFATQSAMAIQNARLYREIEEKGKQLETASQHKSQFLASMSHELRTPLNAILGFNEMILDEVYGEVPADMKDPLHNIQTSGKHLLRLINNVLDLAKIEAGRMELALADYSVQDTVGTVHATLKPLAAEKGLDFVAVVPADLPLAYGDGGRLSQCLMNLAGNALKFTKSGRVEIAVAQENGVLRYSVSDTGIGIPPDKIASLFTEFKQTDATIASEYGGTGLGLSITKKFIEMHGGRIWVESEPGIGSSFRFEIPARIAQ